MMQRVSNPGWFVSFFVPGSELMNCRTTTRSLLRLDGLVVAGLAIWFSVGDSTSAQNAFVNITVTNMGELADAAPDTTLAADLARYFGEDEIKQAIGFHNMRASRFHPVVMLIELKSPDELTLTHQVNNSIRVSPVKDFKAFVEAIDYGRVSGVNEANRSFRIKIRPSEVTKESLLTAAQSSGRRPRGIDALMGPASRTSSRRRDGEYARGDRVRFEFGEGWVTATVMEGGLTFDRARVLLESSRAY